MTRIKLSPKIYFKNLVGGLNLDLQTFSRRLTKSFSSSSNLTPALVIDWNKFPWNSVALSLLFFYEHARV